MKSQVLNHKISKPLLDLRDTYYNNDNGPYIHHYIH